MPTSAFANLQLGFDHYSVRSLGWKARQLLQYAAALRCEVLLLSDLDVFEDRSAAGLRELRTRATDLGVQLYAGTLSICSGSVIFKPEAGTAVEQLRETIRVAAALGSPVARCVLGKVDDRRSPGGIRARMAETVEVLQSCRTQALDAGVKVAVENHAGDLQSRELLDLTAAAGREFVGVTMDAGNATWAMESPTDSLELLAPHALCSGLRDSAVWETPDGAAFEWTAMGQGSVDWPRYFARYAELCPRTPVILEIISARQFDLPFRRDEFWARNPRESPAEFAGFMQLAAPGRPRALPVADLALNPEFQKSELEQSLRYCREVLGIGRR